MRVTLAVSYVVGVVGSRYVMRMEPLASATEDELVRLVAPGGAVGSDGFHGHRHRVAAVAVSSGHELAVRQDPDARTTA